MDHLAGAGLKSFWAGSTYLAGLNMVPKSNNYLLNLIYLYIVNINTYKS